MRRLLLLLLVVGAPHRALAEPADRESALALYKEGLRHYQLAEFQQAVDSFKESYRFDPDPELLFNIAQSYRRLGKDGCAPALDFYRNYEVAVAAHRGKPPAGLTAAIDDMQRCVDDQHTPPAAEPPAPAPGAQAAPVPAEPAPGVAIAAPTVAPRRTRWLELGVAAGGLVAGGAGLGLLLDARSTANDLWTRCGTACPRGSIDDVRLRERFGEGFAAAGVAITGGAVLLWWLHREHPPRAGLSLVPARSGLTITGEF